MSKVSLGLIKSRMEVAEQRRQQFERKEKQPGRLQRHESWRHAYLSRPYLIGASDERVAERFRNIFFNVCEIGEDGRLCPVPVDKNDEFIQGFTHMLEEYGLRTGDMPPASVVQTARQPLSKYFLHGKPAGYRMFEGYQRPETPMLVKYGKREFLEPMLATGRLRLANAKSYNDLNLIDAIRDDETSRTLFVPTYLDRLEGKTHIEVQQVRIPIEDDDLEVPLVFEDYYLFSLCEHIHHRMPTDFGADAALVIRDPALFKQRLISTFLNRFSDWVVMEGAVSYYDTYQPAQDYTKFKVPEMTKHFGYAYQKEVRVAFRSRRPIKISLEPLFLSIGSMSDYADLVHL